MYIRIREPVLSSKDPRGIWSPVECDALPHDIFVRYVSGWPEVEFRRQAHMLEVLEGVKDPKWILGEPRDLRVGQVDVHAILAMPPHGQEPGTVDKEAAVPTRRPLPDPIQELAFVSGVQACRKYKGHARRCLGDARDLSA